MRYREIIIWVVILTSVTLSGSLFATSRIEDIYQSYKSGAYQKTINIINDLPANSYPVATTEYWLGLSYARLQEFSTAIPHFKRAIKARSPRKDIHYELGQALYAMNELSSARKSFKKSYRINYKPSPSLYYVAHISQLLERHADAKQAYMDLYNHSGTGPRMRQVALFQLGEVFVALAVKKHNPHSLIEKYVLPLFKKAISVDPPSEVSKEISKRKQELMIRYQLDPHLMRSGERVPSKAYHLSLAETIKYDTNSTLSTDDPSKQATKEKTTIFDTMVNADYRFLLFKRVAVVTGAMLNHSYYGNRTSPSVYTNDSYSLTPSLKTKIFHRLLNRRANFIFDTAYAYNARDWSQTKQVEYYDQSTSFTVGEKLKYFPWGDTTLKFKLKTSKGHESSLDKKSSNFSLSQMIIMPWRHVGMLLTSIDDLKYTNDSNSDNRTYLMRFDYIAPNILATKLTFSANITTIWLDTKEQKESRGVEFSYTPGLKIAVPVSHNLDLSLSYDFTSNKSKQSDYTYTKHVTSLDVSANY
jgi:tetratricopeptide (TPR) repeat protein